MTTRYRAMQVAADQHLALVERECSAPSPEDVLIRVEACGVCGADLADIRNADPTLPTPRVPGHELVGRIVAMGAAVPDLWSVGQRVGIGRLGGHCGRCAQCRAGRFQRCENQPITGATRDGGYAEYALARHTGLVSIPDELRSEQAAPVLCAGIATFNALRACGAGPGDTVAIFGIGGLGHLAVQYAQRMGFRVVALGRGSEIAAAALRLGAHRYVDTDEEEAVAVLQSMGGAIAIVSTVTDAHSTSTLLPALAPGGRMILLGVARAPLEVSVGQLVSGERAVQGYLTGTPLQTEHVLRFGVLTDAHPVIETLPLEDANEALRRLRSGAVTFRTVLLMRPGV
ncbi:MAG: alcohol dehydrogenase catalytic domain-containing protein [Luteibacter sp.]|uniref:alcohol dehydrogenase catalytic domain-containing protein n=1 Tax=Luteibacter sp. TaxID=1886636 RepID=UPI00280898DA|nr:alcohol dehydrogenase catalytic domain-containing protein [Luteibacter sp.]MDQ7995252.1 alcohol dehydrogenase catalytic domain-containing protein [Luteibacter sp.]